jgi:drug/metabolite transporter (DMT)-like permease
LPENASSASTKAPAAAILVLGLGVVAVSSSAILIRAIQGEGVPSLVIACGRLLIAALLLTPLVMRRYRHVLQELAPRQVMLAIASGAFLALHFALWIESLALTSVLVSVVFVTTSPIWVALLETLVLRASFPRLVLAGLLVAIAGGIVIGLAGAPEASVADSPGNGTLGALMALGGAMAVAGYLVIGRSLLARIPLAPYIWIVYGSGAVFLGTIVLLRQIPWLGFAPQAYGLLVLLAVVPQLIGHSSLNYALTALPATVVGVATQLEPIASAAMALILLGEVPTEGQVIGSLIVLIGIATVSFGQASAPRTST